MTANVKSLLICIFCVLFFFLSAAETIFVPKKAPLFKYEDGWVVKAAAQQEFVAEVVRKERVLMQQEKSIGTYVDVYYLNIPGTKGFCYIPETCFKLDSNGKPVQYFDKIDSLMFLGIFLFLAGLASIMGYLHWKSDQKKYLLPLSLLLFFWGYAAWYLGMTSNSFIIPSDELHYFDIAKRMLNLDFTSFQYRYTIGFPILCMPITLLFHLQSCMEFIHVYMNFQTFILIPALFLLFYWFFQKKMGCSRNQSYCIMLLWLLLIIFYKFYSAYLTDPTTGYVPESYTNNAIFLLFDPIAYTKFMQCTWLGRNALCDYMSVFLLIVLLCFSMKRSRSLIRFFILSMGFGFICMVRINYIFFAPLLAYVFYDSFSELWKDKKNYLYAFLCGTAGFMLVFIWQFILNKIQLGSPFIWPHSLHKFAPDRGFIWSVVPYGFKFLCQTNYIYFLMGFSSFFFIPERKTRVLLTLWIFPMLIFYIGYPGVYHSPIRFTFALYPPLLAAFVMNPVWKATWNIRIKTALVLICASLLCKSNIFFTYRQPWDVGIFGVSNTAYMVIQGIVCLVCCAVILSMRKDLKEDRAGTLPHLRFLILFTVFFFAGSVCSYIAGILLLAAFICGLRDTVLELKDISDRNNTNRNGERNECKS